MFLQVFLVVTLTYAIISQCQCLCIFGDNGCLLPCRCGENICDPKTGHCLLGDKCQVDPILSVHKPANQMTYWGGGACQTGNIAHGKHADQPGAYYDIQGFNATAKLALDGNLDTYAFSNAGSPGHSPIMWWRVDLGSLHNVIKILIVAHNLGNPKIKLDNYTVWVGNDTDVFTHTFCGNAPSPLVKTYTSHGTWRWNEVQCEGDIIGRYVSIRKSEHAKRRDLLPLHEVAVIGYPSSSVKLGYCLKYADSKDIENVTIFDLECDVCIDGWIPPGCKTRNISTTETVALTTVQDLTTEIPKITKNIDNSSSLSALLTTTSVNIGSTVNVSYFVTKNTDKEFIIVVVSAACIAMLVVCMILLCAVYTWRRRIHSNASKAAKKTNIFVKLFWYPLFCVKQNDQGIDQDKYCNSFQTDELSPIYSHPNIYTTKKCNFNQLIYQNVPEQQSEYTYDKSDKVNEYSNDSITRDKFQINDCPQEQSYMLNIDRNNFNPSNISDWHLLSENSLVEPGHDFDFLHQTSKIWDEDTGYILTDIPELDYHISTDIPEQDYQISNSFLSADNKSVYDVPTNRPVTELNFKVDRLANNATEGMYVMRPDLQ